MSETDWKATAEASMRDAAEVRKHLDRIKTAGLFRCDAEGYQLTKAVGELRAQVDALEKEKKTLEARVSVAYSNGVAEERRRCALVAANHAAVAAGVARAIRGPE